ncbi:MAG: hypothetical protein JWM97_2003 [Phycisphaerales bacterium]|nr:hypothetical protein [Phycisphaerales bacterium]
MRRRLFTLLSALSLLVCVGTCVLWARGQVAGDLWVWYDKDCGECISRLAAGAGHVRYSWQDERRLTGWIPSEGHHVVRSPDKGMHPIQPAGQPHLGVPGFRYDRYGTNGYLIDVALWLPFVLTAGLPLLWFIGRRRRSSSQVGLCSKCGYDLRATPDRCPECGTETKNPAGFTGGDKRTV